VRPEVPMEKRTLSSKFQVFATRSAIWVGSKWAFTAAILCILIWAVAGPHFRYSDTWQLVVNTATTIITFLMVFLIQNTQNRDAKAIHLKLDEIIRAIQRANNQMINIEKLSDEELEGLASQFARINDEYEARKKRRKPGPKLQHK
jgi:low affinity Fe/Cu permease